MRSAAEMVAAWMASVGVIPYMHHVMELLCVVAVGINAGVGAEGHFDAGGVGLAEVVALSLADAALLGQLLLGHADLGADLEDVVVVVDVHDEVGAVGLGEGDAFVVDERGVLDGVDAGLDGPLDGLGAVGVGGDLASGLVGGVGGDLEFFEGVLRGAGLIALGEDAAGGHDLDDVDAVFDLLADGLADLVGTVGDAEVAVSWEESDGGFGRVVVEVAVAAGDGEAGAGGDDARARDVAGVDVLAQVDRREGRRADVADGGEAGVEGQLGVDYAGDGLVVRAWW